LCGQKKVTKEKAALARRPSGLPCAARDFGRLRNSRERSKMAIAVGEMLYCCGWGLRCSPSARRHPPKPLCCSAAHKGF